MKVEEMIEFLVKVRVKWAVETRPTFNNDLQVEVVFSSHFLILFHDKCVSLLNPFVEATNT